MILVEAALGARFKRATGRREPGQHPSNSVMAGRTARAGSRVQRYFFDGLGIDLPDHRTDVGLGHFVAVTDKFPGRAGAAGGIGANGLLANRHFSEPSTVSEIESQLWSLAGRLSTAAAGR